MNRFGWIGFLLVVGGCESPPPQVPSFLELHYAQLAGNPSRLGPDWVDRLLVGMGSESPVIRLPAVNLLDRACVRGELDDRQKARVVAAFCSALSRDSDLAVRRQVADTLGKLKEANAVQPLIGALKDSSPRVRRGAIVALGRIGDVRAVGPIVAVAEGDGDINVSSEAIACLAEFGPAGIQALEALVAKWGDNTLIGHTALNTLQRVKGTKVQPPATRAGRIPA